MNIDQSQDLFKKHLDFLAEKLGLVSGDEYTTASLQLAISSLLKRLEDAERERDKGMRLLLQYHEPLECEIENCERCFHLILWRRDLLQDNDPRIYLRHRVEAAVKEPK